MSVLNFNNIFPEPYVDPDPFLADIMFFLRNTESSLLQDYSPNPKSLTYLYQNPSRVLFNTKHCLKFNGKSILKSTDPYLCLDYVGGGSGIIECWVYLEDVSVEVPCPFFEVGTPETVGWTILEINTDRQLLVYQKNTEIIIPEIWTHIAVWFQNSNSFWVWINGVNVYQGFFDSSYFSQSTTYNTFYIGQKEEAIYQYFNGLNYSPKNRILYISQFRVTNATRYAYNSTFDPNDNAQTYYVPEITYKAFDKLYYGATEVQKLYKGSQLLYPFSDPSLISFSTAREGLFHYLGTNGKTTSWVNPLINNKFTCQLYSSTGVLITAMTRGNLSMFFDRSTINQYLYHHIEIGGNIRFLLPNKFKLTKFSIKSPNDGVFHKNFDIVAWNNPNSFSNAITILSLTNLSGLFSNTWYDYDIANEEYYDNYAYIHKGASNEDGYLRGSEIEFFGNIQL